MAKRTTAAIAQGTIPGLAARPIVRRMERAVGASIVAGRSGELADAKWRGAETLARELARAVDTAAADAQVYAIAQLAPRLLDALRELRLTPTSAEMGADPLAEFLRDLTAPAVLDTEE